MKKVKSEKCPGCHTHCTADNIECKFGKKYFEEMEKKSSKKDKNDEHARSEHKKYKAKDFEKDSMSRQIIEFAKVLCTAPGKPEEIEAILQENLNEERRELLTKTMKKISKDLEN